MLDHIQEREKISKSFNEGFYKSNFESLAMSIFRYQIRWNYIYSSYCKYIGRSIENVSSSSEIPYLPISFFRSHAIKAGEWETETIFTSSGTTSSNRSKHEINDLSFYLLNALQGFEHVYGSAKQYCYVAVLPGYQDRPDSSLINMVQYLVQSSEQNLSGFYLGREEEMLKVLENNRIRKIPTILFGVSFALLDLCKYEINFPDLIVIETGGMKTSTLEISKDEILSKFSKAWNINRITSEYGMTELLSQAYAEDDQWYTPSSTMKVVVGELSDPFAAEKEGKTGILKIIDLANFDTCSFIETQDLGTMNGKGQFKVLGRMDNAELRGCNLLLEELI